MIGNLDAMHLLSHGYAVFSNIVDSKSVDQIEKLLDATLESSGGVPTSKTTASEWIKAKSKLQSYDGILNLVNTGQVREHIKETLGEFVPLKSSQIAYRFPMENCEGDSIHIDNFTEKDMKRRSGLPKEFDALIGIVLSDTEQENCGNFTVFPGSHFRFQEWSRKNGGYEYFKQHGFEEMVKSFRSSGAELNPHQLMTKRGDLIVANRFLLHLISAPNFSENIRKIIWFRTKSVKDADTFQNVWANWKFIEDHSLLHELEYTDDLRRIEEFGYGYQLQKGEFMLKSHISIPNVFASMMSARFVDHKLVNIKSNGYLSNFGHKKLLEHVQSSLDEIDELNVAQYIYDNLDYNKMIKEWFPMVDVNETCKQREIAFKYHHIKSLSKSAMIKDWADELGLCGYICKGSPGYLVIRGYENKLDVFEKRLQCMYWKKGGSETNEVPYPVPDEEFCICEL